ncbi:MAG: hypothetical protein GTO45_27285, partial [Candidatus Aminicenantes bacterium]|nr:hypothetical protein [Candidatus Aminicenantes bacterium]NIM82503.1 hypothetical protein [Candidatus Aminicenantes bacterium]NIN21861.1 hypothetical protein [Candidatus Aminicenantes bacterium]NIN45639.1 hypothetical protein [Candidatus Aminicenantes bacterium]NIN88472.1 hypothetical protein [Candidatus Aminicenantes bacterium]
MAEKLIIFGIDIGSVTISIVGMSLEGEILNTHYAFHHGDIPETLHTMLSKVDYRLIKGIACTSASSYFLKSTRSYDSRIACITAA